jgi:hypothetical protein
MSKASSEYSQQQGFPDAPHLGIGYIIGLPAGVSDEASCSPDMAFVRLLECSAPVCAWGAEQIPSSEA